MPEFSAKYTRGIALTGALGSMVLGVWLTTNLLTTIVGTAPLDAGAESAGAGYAIVMLIEYWLAVLVLVTYAWRDRRSVA